MSSEEASRVEAALRVLCGAGTSGSEIAAADEYLRAVRSGLTLWDVAPTLIFGGNASAAAVQFLASGLEEQVRWNWDLLSAEKKGATFNFGLALTAQALQKQVQVAVDRSCTVVAICVSRAGRPDQKPAWHTAMAAARSCGASCDMLCALIDEWIAGRTGSADQIKEKREFAFEECPLAIAEASSVLSKPESSASQKLAAIRCLRSWRPYTERGSLVDILSMSVLDASLSEAAGEALEDEVCDSIGASALGRMCEALRSVMDEAGMRGIQAQVVAQTCTKAAEANMEIMLLSASSDRIEAASLLISLLQTCLLSSTRSAFLAAVEGFAVLSTTAIVLRYETPSVHVILDSLSEGVKLMLVQSKLPPQSDTGFWNDDLAVDDAMVARAIIRDGLLQAAMALGCDAFVQNLCPYLQQSCEKKALEELEAVIFALMAAGDAHDFADMRQSSFENVYPALSLAISAAWTNAEATQLIKSVMQMIETYSELIARQPELFAHAINCIGHRFDICPDNAASSLHALARTAPEQVVPHCDAFLGLFTSRLDTLSSAATTNVACALALAAGHLSSSDARSAALHAIVQPLVVRIESNMNAGAHPTARSKLVSCVQALAGIIRSINDPMSGTNLLRDLAGKIGVIAATNAGDVDVAEALSGLLEAGIAGKISDDESERNMAADPAVVRAIMALVTDTFQRSGCQEPRWLQVMTSAIRECEPHSEEGKQVVIHCLHQTTNSVREIIVGANDPNVVVEIIGAMFSVLNAAHAFAIDCLLPCLPVVLDLALMAAGCADLRASKEVFLWWKKFLLIKSVEHSQMHAAAQGFLAERSPALMHMMLTAIGGRAPHRIVGTVADTLWGVLHHDGTLMQGTLNSLAAALHSNDTPVPWMPHELKSRVERSIQTLCGAGKRRTFRALMLDLSTFCRHGITSDVFLAYEMPTA
mmetsp:Transcript_172/g.543  ORF Transcript_172/g.543 Transcript_172/m.543 type:complete len:933 (+) Transcript_172:169-2967(+)